jgi:uncharacterized protein YndB with AHSA1/START domain
MTVSARPTSYDLTMSRVIPATPGEVFDAYTDAAQQKIWFSLLSDEPGIVEIDVDLRVGGIQHAKWGPAPDQLFWEDQTFLEIDRPHRLVTSSTGGTPDGDTMTTRVEVTFDPDAGGTLMTVHQSGFPTVEMRDFFSTMAWVGAFDRITAYVAGAR